MFSPQICALSFDFLFIFNNSLQKITFKNKCLFLKMKNKKVRSRNHAPKNAVSLITDTRLLYHSFTKKSTDYRTKIRTQIRHNFLYPILRLFLAEKVGFEPTQRANVLRDFESRLFDHLSTSPYFPHSIS